VGNFLRRASLDELPQVFNVIRGEMSFVGPRPIVEDEILRYGEAFSFYTRVKPGITGLWQISGRNDVDYAKRVELDRTYIYNWSVWLDIYIIIRTIPALLTGRGAY
jgi:lipopolysaccharide/colanic/teichoic acid biosynthesis glycosyltransferase